MDPAVERASLKLKQLIDANSPQKPLPWDEFTGDVISELHHWNEQMQHRLLHDELVSLAMRLINRLKSAYYVEG